MSRRRRRRNRLVASVNKVTLVPQERSHRSRLARIATRASQRLAVARVGLHRALTRRMVVAVRSPRLVRPRLPISARFVRSKLPVHVGRTEVRRCVGDQLRSFSTRVSGSGGTRRRKRNDVRREVIQAARRKC